MTSAGTRWAMGTLLRVETEASAPGTADVARGLFFAEVQRLEALLSRFRDDSDVSRVNRAAGASSAAVAPETFVAVSAALEYARATGGAFNPVAGGGPGAVVLDPAARSIFLERAGTSLDLGGIGKGFALDRALERARALPGLDRVHADFGGQLLFWTRGGAASEKVGVEDPARPGRLLTEFEARGNCSVSTSSQAERPGHLVDRRAGAAAAAVASATVAAPTATEAEAWSTALFVAGEKGLPWLDARPDVRAFLFRA